MFVYSIMDIDKWIIQRTKQLAMEKEKDALNRIRIQHIKVGKGRSKPKRKMSAKMKRRNELVKRVMQTTGMSLPQASQYIREQNII